MEQMISFIICSSLSTDMSFAFNLNSNWCSMWDTELKHKTDLSKKAEIKKKNIVKYLLRQTLSGFETIFKRADAALSLSDATSVSSPGVIESV